MTVILASQSPRRQELLARVLNEFDVIPAEIDETVKAGLTPVEYVLSMANQKAEQIAVKYPEALVIGCDTIVALDEIILGKPISKKHAYDMLKQLSNRTHQVHTSIVLIKGDQRSQATVTTSVTFYELTDEEIDQYLDSSEYQDKAGAYGIQGEGSLLVEKICGDYYAVMGLPIGKLNRMLQAFDD